jgi:hypothetical protein
MFDDQVMRLVYGRRITGRMLLGLEAAWPLVSQVLSQGSVVYYGRVGIAGTRMYPTEVLEQALEEPETAERLLAAAALAGNATLAANALHGLELLNSARLPEVAAALADRTEVVHCRTGCFGDYQMLGELARASAERYHAAAGCRSAAGTVVLAAD